MATPPRFAIPGTYLLTRRVTQRKFLLRPDPVVNAIILYLLCFSAKRFGILLHAFTFLSNHGHQLVTDLVGNRVSRFLQYFHSNVARALNGIHKRKENLWSSDKPSCVFVPPRAEDFVDKMSYVICNGVLSGLVSRMNQWPGVKMTADEVGALTITVQRPSIFEHRRSMPEVVTITTTLPACIDATPEELVVRIRQRCRELEQKQRSTMVASGRAFMGVKKILAVDPESSPSTPDPVRTFDPHIACLDASLRVQLLTRLKQFRSDYFQALERFRSGKRGTLFPWGTLKMVLDLRCLARPPDEYPNLGALALS